MSQTPSPFESAPPSAPDYPYGVPPLYDTDPAKGRPAAGSASAADSSGLASFRARVAAALLDILIGLFVPLVPIALGILLLFRSLTAESGPSVSSSALALFALSTILSLAFTVWNHIIRQGRTGQTLGKKVAGILVVGEASYEPIGVGASFLRYLAQVGIGMLTLGIGAIADNLWPLWDPARQTLHDKVVHSIVSKDREPQGDEDTASE